ncbi:hypothetical protein [Labedella endophytica]|uniref:hypothetical protein n=1 Tax=Labedella endophytica TaxID=1523160 RepID=UPI001408CBD7|nr:hypothetical protein [Labedella endophytica]
MRETSRNTPSTVRSRTTDPAYSVLTVAAGTLLLAGTTSTVAVSTLELAQTL